MHATEIRRCVRCDPRGANAGTKTSGYRVVCAGVAAAPAALTAAPTAGRDRRHCSSLARLLESAQLCAQRAYRQRILRQARTEESLARLSEKLLDLGAQRHEIRC